MRLLRTWATESGRIVDRKISGADPGIARGVPDVALYAGSAAAGGAAALHTGTRTSTGSTIPALYQAFGNGVTVTGHGNCVVLKSNALADHTSPYAGTGTAKYEAYNGT